MMESYKNKFYDYYHSNLSSQERDDMEKALAANPELAQEYNDYSNMLQHLQKREQINTALINLQEVNKEYLNQNPATEIPVKKMNWLRVAAVVIPLLLLSAALMYFINSQEPKGALIYASQYEVPVISIANRGGDQDVISLEEALIAYNQGDFSTALKGLAADQAPEQTRSQISLARAISLHETGENNKAMAILQELAQNDEVMASTANWYIAMLFLQSNDIENAKNSLKNVDAGSKYYAQSENILKKLQ